MKQSASLLAYLSGTKVYKRDIEDFRTKRKIMSTQSVHHNDDPSEQKPHEVSVSVDGVEQDVPAGTYLVSDFKRLIGVDPSKELDEIIHGEFKPLDDNAKITIEKHEKFVSHVRTGRSS